MSSNKNAKSTIADLRTRLNASEAKLEQARTTIAELRAQLHQQEQQRRMPRTVVAASAAAAEDEEDDGPSWHELADAALRADAARQSAVVPLTENQIRLQEEQRKKAANNAAAFRATPEYRRQQLSQARAVRNAMIISRALPAIDPRTIRPIVHNPLGQIHPNNRGGKRTRRRYKPRSTRKRHTRRR